MLMARSENWKFSGIFKKKKMVQRKKTRELRKNSEEMN